MHDSHDLSLTDCVGLLRAGTVGRIALSTPGGPHILPIGYAVVDETIVVRTSPYSLLGTYGRDSRLAFEIDHFGREGQSGWSVVAHGRAKFVTDLAELARIRDVGVPEPWATGARQMYVRLKWDELSGRRFTSDAEAEAEMGS